MIRAVVAVGLALAVSPASAQTLDLSPLPGVVGSITVPPPQFDHRPKHWQVMYLDPEGIQAMCALVTGHRDFACSVYHPATGVCQSFLVNDFTAWQLPLAIRHEAGVCNEYAAGYGRSQVERDFVEP